MLARAAGLVFLVGAFLVGPQVAFAERPAGAAEAAPVVPIRVGNRTVVTLRGSLLGYTAEERAAAAERRLQDLIEQAGAAPLKAGTRDAEIGVAVEMNGHAVFLVTPDDVNALLDETPALVAEEAARTLERAVAEAREERQPRALMIATARVAVVTIIWLFLLRGVYLSNHWVGTRLSLAGSRVAPASSE